MDVKKVLLVSTNECEEVEECLQHTDCQVIKVYNGAAAVDRAKHTSLDAVILVSAGRDMDRAETALNLRDINPSMEIILIARDTTHGEKRVPIELLGGTIPKTRVLTLHELDRFLTSPDWLGTASER